jgi:hypothetical protein
MKRNVFKYLRKKILEYSTITEEFNTEKYWYTYKIECLGFEHNLDLIFENPSLKYTEGLLIDKLVENPDFMKKLEQIETRKDNLKELLG